jgi:hypothetical protein
VSLSDGYCIADGSGFFLSKFKEDEYYIVDSDKFLLSKISNDRYYIADSNKFFLSKISGDGILINENLSIEFADYFTLLANVLFAEGISNILNGNNVKTVDYLRWEGVIIKRGKNAGIVYLLPNIFYVEIELNVIITSKSESYFATMQEAVRNMPALVKKYGILGDAVILVEPSDARLNTAQRGVWQEEYRVKLLVPMADGKVYY